MFEEPSAQARAVLQLLRDYNNVLLAGPPAVGKSRLLAEVLHWFAHPEGTGTELKPNQPDPFGAIYPDWIPSPERRSRETWTITFQRGTKYRDFIAGIMPTIGANNGSFSVTHGPLFHAARHAADSDGASLVLIDEINRGPAVAIFGEAITAMERDKRLLPDGSASEMTAHFQVLDETGNRVDLSLPHHVYLLGAMNEADTSVEPLDVAFRRRWFLYRLLPDSALVRSHLSLPAGAATPPQASAEVSDLYEALAQAWAKVNERIVLGRGEEFQLGHGIFMDKPDEQPPTDFPGASKYALEAWRRIHGHAAEVFFGDNRGLAAVLGAKANGNGYQLLERIFADNPVSVLTSPHLTETNIYEVLRTVATEAGAVSAGT